MGGLAGGSRSLRDDFGAARSLEGGLEDVREALPGPGIGSPEWFSAFYRAHLPDVYGYLLRLCAGDRAQAEDLTQDVWLALMEELRRGRTNHADVRWLITVARSRFIDRGPT